MDSEELYNDRKELTKVLMYDTLVKVIDPKEPWEKHPAYIRGWENDPRSLQFLYTLEFQGPEGKTNLYLPDQFRFMSQEEVGEFIEEIKQINKTSPSEGLGGISREKEELERLTDFLMAHYPVQVRAGLVDGKSIIDITLEILSEKLSP